MAKFFFFVCFVLFSPVVNIVFIKVEISRSSS